MSGGRGSEAPDPGRRRPEMSEELFRDFWWLMFPVFGMVMAILGMVRDNSFRDHVIRQARENLERK